MHGIELYQDAVIPLEEAKNDYHINQNTTNITSIQYLEDIRRNL